MSAVATATCAAARMRDGRAAPSLPRAMRRRVVYARSRVRVERVRAGEERTFGRIDGGLRGYLAIGEREAQAPIRARARRPSRHPRDAPVRTTSACARSNAKSRRSSIASASVCGRCATLRVDIPADLRSIGMQCGTRAAASRRHRSWRWGRIIRSPAAICSR